MDVRSVCLRALEHRHPLPLQATYLDVVPNERLVYVYEMRIDDAKISVSLATVTLAPEGAGTLLTITEQGPSLTATTIPARASEGPRRCSTSWWRR